MVPWRVAARTAISLESEPALGRSNEFNQPLWSD